MAKTLLVCGFGTGISSAVAKKFGKEGFGLALVGRSAERLTAGVKALEAEGCRAAAFPADLADEGQVRAMVDAVRAKLGPISAIHWNAYSAGAGDLLKASAAEIRKTFELPVTTLLVTVQAALADLKAEKGALLVTNGGLGIDDPAIDATAVAWNAMDLAVANAAKHKLVGVLAQKLKPENVYVGEVLALGPVKGTAWDNGSATIEATSIANRFWELYTARSEITAKVG
jgi:short-subunit dehydrogenase